MELLFFKNKKSVDIARNSHPPYKPVTEEKNIFFEVDNSESAKRIKVMLSLNKILKKQTLVCFFVRNSSLKSNRVIMLDLTSEDKSQET